MDPVKPIETLYKGCLFRSRLEARWATFFDALGICWRYEVEGYETPRGMYLPDFWLPDQDYIVEIKPTYPGEDEQQKLAYVGDYLNDVESEAPCHGAFVSTGPLTAMHGPFGECATFLRVFPDWDCDFMWCRCTSCGRYEIQFEGRTDRMRCKEGHGGECPRSAHGDKGWNARDPYIARAYAKANQKRFEHEDRERA